MSEANARRFQHRDGNGRLRCDVCPRGCAPADGETGLCGARLRTGDRIVPLTPDGVSSVHVDPIEKKPLHHFRPGARTLSIGTLGCELSCAFCQNESLSRARDPVLTRPLPAALVPGLARDNDCPVAAFTYNDPAVVAIEWTIEAARACRDAGLETVAVTAGSIVGEARRELFAVIDAANVDLKSFNDDFYRKHCGGRLEPILDTLRHIRREADTWLEVTTLIIPGLNDGDDELDALTRWMVEELGADTPWHVGAFHPAGRMPDRPRTPHATLIRAWEIGKRNGLHHVYAGNVRDPERSSTRCGGCGKLLIGRDGWETTAWSLRFDEGGNAACPDCGTVLSGRFSPR